MKPVCEKGMYGEATEERHAECKELEVKVWKKKKVDIIFSSHKHCGGEANGKASKF